MKAATSLAGCFVTTAQDLEEGDRVAILANGQATDRANADHWVTIDTVHRISEDCTRLFGYWHDGSPWSARVEPDLPVLARGSETAS